MNQEEDPPKTDALSKKSDNSNEKGVVKKQANVWVEDKGDKVSNPNTFHEQSEEDQRIQEDEESFEESAEEEFEEEISVGRDELMNND